MAGGRELSILIDTGIFFAFYNRRDVHHLDSICLLTHILEGRWGRPFTTILVISEVTTLLRFRLGIATAEAFLGALQESGISLIFVDEDLYKMTVEVLHQYRDRPLSFTDANIIATMKTLGIEHLASYDERAFAGLVPSIIGRGYSATLTRDELNRILDMVRRFVPTY